jgi:hypothetical protein
VAYPVSPQERFDELKCIIHQASVFEGFAYGRREIPAHMTIAEFLTIEDSLRLCADLRRADHSGAIDWSTLFRMQRSVFSGAEHSC